MPALGGYPSKISLLYDKAGRLVRDEAGRTLRYDAMGRLIRVESPLQGSGDYGYDAFDRMAWQQVDSTQCLHRLYYTGSQLSNEWISPATQKQQSGTDKVIRYLGTVAQTTLASNKKEETLLQGTDLKNSVIAVCRDTLTDQSYTPYGQSAPHDDPGPHAGKGYNGERRDPVTGTSHLGNGYRAYNPVLMRFHCPDSESPFGAGGVNPYAYCGGDPVNHADPGGHINWWSVGFGIFGIVAGTAAAVLLAPVTGGASLALLAVVTASAVASGALDIASGVLEDSHPELSQKLGTAALVVGIPAMIDGVALLSAGMLRSGYQLVREAPKLLRQANELYNSGVRSLLKARSALSVAHTPGLGGRGAANVRSLNVRTIPCSFFDSPNESGTHIVSAINRVSGGGENEINTDLVELFSTNSHEADFIWVQNFAPRHGVSITSTITQGLDDAYATTSLLSVHSTDIGRPGMLRIGNGADGGGRAFPVEIFARGMSERLPGFNNSFESENNILLLGVCYAGQEDAHGFSVAQRFANAARINVVASTGDIKLSGNPVISSITSSGYFKFFRPIVGI